MERGAVTFKQGRVGRTTSGRCSTYAGSDDWMGGAGPCGLHCISQSHIEVLIARTSVCDLFGNRVIAI
jgi:hypothetical protein